LFLVRFSTAVTLCIVVACTARISFSEVDVIVLAMAKPILSGPGKVDEQFSTLLKRCLGGIPGQGCGCSCPCKILPGVVDTITDDLEWEALHTEFTGDEEGALIAQAAVKLFQDSHDALAQRATLVLYRG
jgi:hypothetical protein